MEKNNYLEESDEKILIVLANARITAAGCGGHKKADRNYKLVHQYEDELKKRGIEIPTDTTLYEVGIFNGEGSS